MRDPKRLALFGLFLGLIVFLGLLFAPFVMANIISPLALFAWLFLRMFVLSIDQQYYWWFLILLGIIWVARFFFRGPPAVVEPLLPTPNATMKSVDNWRALIYVAEGYSGLRVELKRELRQMLISLFSSRHGNSAFSEVYEPLQKRQIPLPEPVYAFLFEPELVEEQRSFMEKLRALPQTLRQRLTQWRRAWTGQETAEYYQSIEAVLTFMESMLEVPYDNQSDERGKY